ncbi:FAD-dependent oxidoreductase [Mycolicibacterium sp. ND9-15]|uniref:flavin monoamine oxidase family protein n=1 Tax=Mycolicibacterium sp. ND9-15 TaxID=3042320 RepID=UPI002DDBF5F0|nr:FAD-dependent oxidoreductase [Mycolicibacterium sp. ND9-15]WSE55054.1 FAD-dependent oxidoreductase [Mycolicibacterium sp. ND9-15]
MGLEADVAVIGAGLAGLTAARTLRSAGVDAVVLEARDRVGGRTLNQQVGGSSGEAVVEMGGQWIGAGHDRIRALIEDLGLATFDTYDQGAKLWEQNGRVRRYSGQVPKASALQLVDLHLALSRLERMARQVDPATPWSAARALEWDSQTVASWATRHARTSVGRAFIGLLCEAVWAADPADLSLLHLLAYANSSGGLTRLISTSGGAQQSRIVGGSQRITLAMAADLGESIRLNAAVRGIDWRDGVELATDIGTVRARQVIVAMSPTLAGRLNYHPALPADRDQLTQRMPNGSVIKCMAVYDEPFWRANGLSGQGVSVTGPVKVFFDNSPPSGRPGILLGFLEGNQARKFGRLDRQARREAVLADFTKMFGPRASRPDEYIDKAWADDEWTRGCYGAFLPPNTWTSVGSALRTPIGPIHWAGAETATRSMGYMDGAISSGEHAASEVLAVLSGQNASR